ncbi:bacteriocin [Pseudodesulfovibrio sp.]|uniref:bacteriocin n=1 Tax=unclassified Pseudodesulfovibrio TaxID=2661612 RepID=UPI003AFF76C9
MRNTEEEKTEASEVLEQPETRDEQLSEEELDQVTGGLDVNINGLPSDRRNNNLF